MLNYVAFKTELGNYYFCDKNNRIHYCHPIMAWIINNYNKQDVEIVDEKVNLSSYGMVNATDYLYYLDKFKAYKKNGLFEEVVKDNNKLSKRMEGEDIEKTLANMRQITFEVIDFCNIDCEYCAYSSLYNDYDERVGKKLDFTLVKNLLDFLLEKWNSNLNTSIDKNIYISFYGGEPLTNVALIKKTVNYVKSLNAKKNRFTFTMTTNAIMLERHIEFFVENNFNLLISLDGNEKHNSYRYFKNGKSSFDLVVKNIDYVMNNFPSYFKDNVNFNAVIHNRNSVEEVFEFFKTKYNKVPSIGELNTSGIAPEYQQKFLDMYSNSHKSYSNSKDKQRLNEEMFVNLPIVQTLAGFLAGRSGSTYKDYNDLLMPKPKKAIRKPTGTCSPFSKKMFVTVNGRLLPCESVGHENSLGNVNRKGVYLNNQNIAERYNLAYDKVVSRCSTCNINDDCTQCMIYNHNLSIDDLTCSSYVSDEKYQSHLSFYMSELEKHPQMYSEIMTKIVTV